MKIEEAKNAILNGDYSQKARDDLHKALKRSGDDWNRCQHCFILGYELSQRIDTEAWSCAFSLMSDAENMYAKNSGICQIYRLRGDMYFRMGNYAQAYEEARNWEIIIEKTGTGFRGVELDLLRSILLRDNFVASEELMRVHSKVGKETKLWFRNTRIYYLTGAVVLAVDRNNFDIAKQAQAEALQMMREQNQPSQLEIVLKQNRVTDPITVPKAVIEYINKPI